MMVFMPLVMVLIGQFCREVIGHQDLKVAVIGLKIPNASNREQIAA